ncbi:hypothetical protein MFUL124B02_10730 [Myxococcus fulvus 124B02]|nr:hypothetical protein MFUL124B02_10730 [Myxococcus fulvus 124B02]
MIPRAYGAWNGGHLGGAEGTRLQGESSTAGIVALTDAGRRFADVPHTG